MRDDFDFGAEQTPLSRFVRGALAWVALVVVITLTLSFIGAYRSAMRARETRGGQEATGTPEPTSSVEPADGTDGAGSTGSGTGSAQEGSPGTAEVYVLVLADGLNLRTRPMTSATVVKQLAKDTRLVLLEKGSGWYRVRDPEGDEGWVAAGGRYTELVEP